MYYHELVLLRDISVTVLGIVADRRALLLQSRTPPGQCAEIESEERWGLFKINSIQGFGLKYHEEQSSEEGCTVMKRTILPSVYPQLEVKD